MDKEPGFLQQALLFAALLVVAYGAAVLILSLEKIAAPQAPAVTGKGPSSPSQPAALFSFPVDYSASVTQYGDGIKMPRTRFYIASSKKGAK